MTFLLSLLAVPAALTLDAILGEPKRFHPLIGFGVIAKRLDALLNKRSILLGAFAWLLAVVPIVACVILINHYLSPLMQWLFTVFCAWIALGWKSLHQHAAAVFAALNSGDLAHARVRTSYMVSRNTDNADETALSRATIESLLENGSDAIFAALFWLILLGAPGVVLYRLSNTLDAMWGYRNERYEQFGKCAARIDDVLNYLPARLTAMLYVVCGNSKQALNAWQQQAKTWYSPNAGVVMASGAGALNLRLGGVAKYHGKQKQRPELGFGSAPSTQDIQRALVLLNRSVYLFGGVILCVVFCAALGLHLT